MITQRPKLIIFDNDGVLIDAGQAMPGIAQVLDFLQAHHIDRCVASNGDQAYIQRALSLTNLKKYFDDQNLFGVSATLNPKPAPDLFLHAAWFFHVEAQDCLVIEDHPMGIAAAQAAKMPVIGFLGAGHAQHPTYRREITEAKPSYLAEDAVALLALLKSLV